MRGDTSTVLEMLLVTCFKPAAGLIPCKPEQLIILVELFQIIRRWERSNCDNKNKNERGQFDPIQNTFQIFFNIAKLCYSEILLKLASFIGSIGCRSTESLVIINIRQSFKCKGQQHECHGWLKPINTYARIGCT